MLKVPETYLNSILSDTVFDKDLTKVILYFIQKSKDNLHFIIDEKEINVINIISELSLNLILLNNEFVYKVGQYVFSFDYPGIYKIESLYPQILLSGSEKKIFSLKNCIPVTNRYNQRIGNIKSRINAYKNYFKIDNLNGFFNNEKLLVIGNKSLFISIPKEYPACFVIENENIATKIEYNSPILPRIVILKNINLLDNYQNKEINGDQVNFSTCIFVGSSKFDNSVNIIRNYYNQRRFKKLVFIGEKDIKIDLGNNQVPLRWKWTIPEINFFKGKRNIQHKHIIISNSELENAIAEFYQAIREIENKHTIGLKSIYRFIRRIYYDWNLKQETTLVKLQQIQNEFDTALKQLLIETLGNIFSDFDFEEYQKPLSEKFAAIINSVKTNNKSEKLKTYHIKIHQLILPSFKCNENKNELNDIFKKSQQQVRINSLQAISDLQNAVSQHWNNPNRNYFSLIANGTKTEIISYSKSDDSNEGHHKVISSIYGSGKVEKLIERLSRAKSEYKLLLYSIEEKALKHHIESYISDLNKEYISQDRFQISGVEFSDSYYQFSNYDELIEALTSAKQDYRETDNYKLTYIDNSKLKLPSTKTVLKIQGDRKYIVLVEDLNIGDKVLIYSNPDKKLLRDIMELMNPDLIKKADEYSLLWRTCLLDAYRSNIMAEPLYKQLVKNHLSVSESTFIKYISGEVMFPRSFSDLIIIAKTINDPRLSFDFLKNTMKPKIEEYRGMEIEYGFKFSNSINHFIISGEADEFISEWLTVAEIENIVSQIPVRTIKDVELITQDNDD